jgi:hypothetical protein
MAQTIPLSVPDDLLEEVRETARITHLSVADVFRQSAKLAAPALRQSSRQTPPKGQSAWDVLAKHQGLTLQCATPEDRVAKVVL